MQKINSMNNLIVYGIILSAGLSGRMGKFKPLLNHKGKSFIQNIALKLNSVCTKTIIVTGFKSNEVEHNVNQLNINSKINFVFNEQYERGMFASLQAGLKASKNPDWIFYHFVDQPGLPVKFYSECVKQIDDKHNWIQPSFKGQNGHPILIHSSVFELIINSPINSSLRVISKNSIVKKKIWACEFEEVLQDVDTKSDLSGLV
jgi:CTP:molybdopterin cytidylyltransferase MocA